jgi:hypothetical protein
MIENAIGRVALEAIDPGRRDRVVGRILSLSPRPIASAPRRPEPGVSLHAR